MPVNIRLFSTLVLGASLAACGTDSPQVDGDLARDLEQISGGSLELAPSASGTQVVSQLEMAPKAAAAVPRQAPERVRTPQPLPRPRARVVQAPAPRERTTERVQAPAEVAESPAPEPELQPAAAAPRPIPAPLGAGAPPPGGWRNVNDVIRNSRVPINP